MYGKFFVVAAGWGGGKTALCLCGQRRCTAKRQKINRSRAKSGKSQSHSVWRFYVISQHSCFTFFCVSRHHGHINNRHSRAYKFGTLAGENADWRKNKRGLNRLENERRQRSEKGWEDDSVWDSLRNEKCNTMNLFK